MSNLKNLNENEFSDEVLTHAASSLHCCHSADIAKLDRFKRFCAFNWFVAFVIVVLAVFKVLLHSTLDWSITLWFCWLNCCLWFSTCALNWFNTCALSAFAFSTAIWLPAFKPDILLPSTTFFLLSFHVDVPYHFLAISFVLYSFYLSFKGNHIKIYPIYFSLVNKNWS